MGTPRGRLPISLIGAPLRSGALEGAELFPAALRAAGALDSLHRVPGGDPIDAGDAISVDGPEPIEGYPELTRVAHVRTSLLALAKSVAHEVEAGRTPVVAGGDCVALLGVLAGVLDGRHPPTRIGLVSLDGDAEFRLPEKGAATEIARRVLLLAVGKGEIGMSRLARERFPLVEESDVVRLGARNLSPAERTSLEKSRILFTPLEKLTAPGGIASVGASIGRRAPHVKEWVVHLSASVLDPALAPFAVGQPAAGGLTSDQVTRVMQEVGHWSRAGSIRVAAVVLTGVDPRKDPGLTGTAGIWKALLGVLGR